MKVKVDNLRTNTEEKKKAFQMKMQHFSQAANANIQIPVVFTIHILSSNPHFENKYDTNVIAMFPWQPTSLCASQVRI